MWSETGERLVYHFLRNYLKALFGIKLRFVLKNGLFFAIFGVRRVEFLFLNFIHDIKFECTD